MPYSQVQLSAADGRTIGAALVGGLYLVHVALFGDYVADDAGISLAYGRHMVAGYGPVVYPGGEAVEAYSNPLWTALLGIAAAAGLDGQDGIPLLKTLGVVFGLATLALTAQAGRVAYNHAGRIAWIAPALLASLTPFTFWTSSGMENGLFAFLMLLAFTLQMRELRGTGRFPWSSLALAALALTRPEGIAFTAAFLIHRILLGDDRRRLLAWVGITCGIYAAFLGTRLLMYGEWVPNTYYAKVALYDRALLDIPGYLANAADRGTAHLLDASFAVWPLLVLAAAGLSDPGRWRANVLLAAILVGTALYVVYVGGDFWPAGRFFTATLPFVALAVQHAFSRVGAAYPRAPVVAAAVLVGITLNQSLQASAALRVQHDGNALISLQGRLDTARRLQALAAALQIHDPLVLDPDIGGLAVAGLRVLDLGGLADVHIARFHWHAPFFRDYVFRERRPDFIRTHATWTQSTGITGFPELDAEYVAVRAYEDALGRHGEFVRRDHLEGRSPARTAAREPSWRQAIEDGRARRAREQARGHRP